MGVNTWAGDAWAASEVYPKGELDPTELRFSIVERYRNFALIGANFVELDDTFDTENGEGYEAIAPSPEDHAGDVSVGGGSLRVNGESYFALFKSDTGQRAPFAAVAVSVRSFAETGSGSQDSVYAGLVKDESNYIVAWYNHRQKLAGIDAVVDGEVNALGSVEARLSAPTRFAFALTENKITAFAETPEGDEGTRWRPLLRADAAEHIDLRRPSVLAEYKNSFGARASSGTIVLTEVQAGYFGEAGTRDPHVITHADGTPYIRDGKVYLTFTQAGLAFFETAHWGVWTLDLSAYELDQVANLFFMREGVDAVLGDHAGHLVVDERNGRFIVSTSTWGDFSFDEVHINYTTVPTDVDLLHGVHVLRTRRLPLPTEALPTATAGQWDPHIVCIRGRWYVAFVNARRFFDFYPALAVSDEGGDFTDLSLAGADATKVETEGTVMQKIGGEWYVLASNGDNSAPEQRDRYPIYNLAMRQVGRLDAPHPTQIPWPMVFPVPAGRKRTRYILVTFNIDQYYPDLLGYGTHGDFFVMEAAETMRGQEFPSVD